MLQVHYSDVDFEYHFSWIPHPERTFNWPQARKYCRSLGMESISMETAAKWKLVKDVFASGNDNLKVFTQLPLIEDVWGPNFGLPRPNLMTLPRSFADPPLRFIWTSGRKCNYPGCPPNDPFWFWSSSYVPSESKRIVTKNSDCGYCEWGGRGSLRKPQPDNRFASCRI